MEDQNKVIGSFLQERGLAEDGLTKRQRQDLGHILKIVRNSTCFPYLAISSSLEELPLGKEEVFLGNPELVLCHMYGCCCMSYFV